MAGKLSCKQLQFEQLWLWSNVLQYIREYVDMFYIVNFKVCQRMLKSRATFSGWTSTSLSWKKFLCTVKLTNFAKCNETLYTEEIDYKFYYLLWYFIMSRDVIKHLSFFLATWHHGVCHVRTHDTIIYKYIRWLPELWYVLFIQTSIIYFDLTSGDMQGKW